MNKDEILKFFAVIAMSGFPAVSPAIEYIEDIDDIVIDKKIAPLQFTEN